MKNIFNKLRLKDKYVLVLLVIVFAVSLLPVVRLMMDARLTSDDLWYGSYVKKAIDAYGFSIPVLYGGLKWCVTSMWSNWQGTYTSAAFMAVFPGTIGEQYYFTGLLNNLIVLLTGSMYLSYIIARKALKLDKTNCMSLAIIISITILELMYNPSQGLYWYNSAVHYTLITGFMFIMLALFVNIAYENKRVLLIIEIILSCIFSFLTAGGNFSTIIYGLIFTILLAALLVMTKNKRIFAFIPGFIFYVFGFMLNVCAPGNLERKGNFDGYSIPESIVNSVLYGIKEIPSLTVLELCFYVAMAVPILLKAVKKLDYSFKYPYIVSALSFLIYASGLSTSFYGLGEPPLARTWCAIKYVFIVLVFINVAYWCGYFCKKISKLADKIKDDGRSNPLQFIIPALILVIILCVSTTYHRERSNISYTAYNFVHSGVAHNFSSSFDEQISKIKEEKGGDVTVKALYYRPWFLVQNNFSFSDYAAWYEVNSITEEY